MNFSQTTARRAVSIGILALFTLMLPAAGLAQKSKPGKPKQGQSSAKVDNKTSANASVVLATVGGDPITYGELENAFRRNMNRRNAHLNSVKKDSVMDFLNLYIKYRLKVKDALARNFDKDSAVMAEVNSNRKLLSETFLFDKKVVEPNVEKFLQRRLKEVQVGVMVFAIPQGENSDTVAAYNRALKCIELVKKGEDFKKIAKDSSDDKTTRENGGVLPFITSLGGVIKPLEDAAYSLKPGEIYPTPIRSRFVYLVVKLLREQPHNYVRASQLLVPGYENEDSLAVAKRADSLVAALQGKSREVFAEAARKLSIDKSSAEKGGDIGFYSRSTGTEGEGRRMMPEFEEKMFELKDGEVGKINTIYGWHIIRRDSTRPINPETERGTVKASYKKYYFEDDKRAYLDDTKKKLGMKWDDAVFMTFLDAISHAKTTQDTSWAKNIGDDLKQKTIYHMPQSRNLTCGDLVDSLRKRKDLAAISLNKNGMNNAINKISDPYAIAEATKPLENEYSDFASLIREFRDGILLFKVEEQEVWNKLKFDSTLARVYFDSTKGNYFTEVKYDVTEIYCLNDSTAQHLLKQAKNMSASEFESLAETNTQRAEYRSKKGRWGVLSVKNSKLAQVIDPLNPKSGTVIGPVPFEKGFSVIRVNEVQNPRPKTFEEAIPDFAPKFQDMMQKRLSENWIEGLRKKFGVVINEDKVNAVLGMK